MTLFSQVMTAVCVLVSPLHYPPTSLVWPLNLSMISVGSLDTCGAECDTCPVSRACNSGDVVSRHDNWQHWETRHCRILEGIKVVMSRK